MTKADAIKLAQQKEGEDSLGEMIDSLAETKKLFEAYLALIRTATARIFIARAAAALSKAA